MSDAQTIKNYKMSKTWWSTF